MADTFGQFEIKDNQGSSVAFSGTANTTPQNIPASPGNVISGVVITVQGNNVEVSFDGGTTYYEIPRNATFVWNVKGMITEFQIRTTAGNRNFRGILNLEEF